MARLADPDLALRRRRQVLDAALVCFRRRGFHQATVQEICAEAEISAGALYRYFRSKADIIAAIAEDHRQEADAMLDAVKRGGDLFKALSSVSLTFFQKCDRAEEGALLCDIISEATRDETLHHRLMEIDATSRVRLSSAVAAAQARGEVDQSLVAEDAADALFAMMEGLGVRNAITRNSDAATLAERFQSMAKRYLANRR